MIERARPIAAVAAALLALGWALAAAQGGASATASAMAEHGGPPAVGDTIVIAITVTHAADAEAAPADAIALLDPLDPAVPEIERRSPTETRITLRSRAFQTGLFEIAPPDIVVRSGGTREIVVLEPLRIEIVSVLGEGAELRPNAPPAAPGSRGFAPWLAGLIALAAAFAVTTILRALLRRRRPPPAAQPAEPAPAAELPQPGGDAESFCRELSARVRAHLSEAWGVPAASLTPAELQRALAEAGAPRAAIERARSLIAECDEARFSGAPPPPAKLHRYRALAESVIAETDPR